MRVRAGLACAFLLVASACSGGGSSPAPAAPSVPVAVSLTIEDAQRVIAQAAGEARARNLAAHIALVDRVGNVLGVFRMSGALPETVVGSDLGIVGGLEGTKVPAQAAAISKAVTAAYLSSNGNAFSTRTASQIVQEHFNPQERGQPSGPLYGVQFSQLACSDVIQTTADGLVGPRPSPLGLAGDPGGLPLYKEGVLVGGIGIEIDGRYGIDRDITDVDASVEEAVATAGSFRFESPVDIRADRITADGRTFRYAEPATLASEPAAAPAYASLGGELVGLPPFNSPSLWAGAQFGTAASGLRAAGEATGAWVLVDGANSNRFPIRAGPDGKLAAADVEAILAEGLAIARRARGQIRRPLGSTAEVSITVVDSAGAILGIVRTPDAPLFGIDVAVQKARTAAYFSTDIADAFADPLFTPAPTHQPANVRVDLGQYLPAAAAFVGDAAAFRGGIAWSARAIGNLHRPYFPDGIDGAPNGPFSTPIGRWSPFNLGFQEDLVYTQLVKALGGSFEKGCVARLPGPQTRPVHFYPQIANGIQIFPGGIPIYRGNQLVGAVGVSGDGVDQDDMIAFLGLANAGRKLNNGVGNAPQGIRADRLAPMGTRLRYVQCPQSPFNNSTEQNVCAGL